MPKKIENVREKLLEEARRQIEERGYKELTVRSVASELEIGLGTLYNYFASKDMLVASFILDDWNEILELINKGLSDAETKYEKLRVIYEGIAKFYLDHLKLFADPAAKKTFTFTVDQRHPIFLGQISAMILPLVSDSDISDRALLADYIAESVIRWSMTERSFTEIEPIFKKLF